ncbi:MAG: hypothetical protein U9P73_04770 [Candidatus Cloacimonadota bacterium]|nr:hypothetical protein [Candidatus Cloacimonadota bacterium]
MKVKESINIDKGDSNQQIIEPGMWNPSLFEWRDVIEDYLLISRKRINNRLSMFKLQLELMGDIYKTQETIKAYKDILKNPSNITKYNKTASEKDISNANLTHLEKEVTNCKLIIKALKEISDGHLWRMFDFNRSLMYCLGTEDDPGYLQLDEGGLKELNNWGNQIKNESKVQFILNSLTNYARIGDVIVKNNNGIIEVKEIKSSTSCSGKKWRERLKRQKQRRENFVSFANNKVGKLKGNSVHIEHTSIKPKYDFTSLENILYECETNGVSSKIMNNYLGLIATDLSKPQKTQMEYRNLIQNMFNTLKKGNDIIIPGDSQIRKKYSPNFTPFTIYPIKEKYIADLILGKKRIYYYINISEIFRIFDKNGWIVLSYFKDTNKYNNEKEKSFCVIKHNELTISISWMHINQVIFDFLDLESLIELYDYTYKQKDIKKERILYNFKSTGCWV